MTEFADLARHSLGEPGDVGNGRNLFDEYSCGGATIRGPPTNYPWAYEFHVEAILMKAILGLPISF